MHLLLTDRLTCPRCGPDFGLILLADQMDDRQVLEGSLGCSNCRDNFPIRAGFGDLRAPPRGALPPGRAGTSLGADAEEVEMLHALLGVTHGPGTLALVGAAASRAEGLATVIDGAHVVAIDPATVGWPEQPHVSRMVAAPGMPFFTRSLRGACLDGALDGEWLDEAARVVAPGSRVVVLNAPESASERFEQGGLTVIASDAGTVVAARG